MGTFGRPCFAKSKHRLLEGQTRLRFIRNRVFGIFRAKKVLPLFSSVLPVIDPIPGQKLLRLFHTTFGNVNGF